MSAMSEGGMRSTTVGVAAATSVTLAGLSAITSAAPNTAPGPAK